MLNEHFEVKQTALGKLKACPDFSSEFKLEELKAAVEESSRFLESLPRASAPPEITSLDDYECLVCLNPPQEKVFMCNECRGTLCDLCKTKLESSHEPSRSDESLRCPQCRAVVSSEQT